MGARLVCSILMHLCVESDIRQGLRMMKYAVNHHESFDYPKCAFFVGFMQYAGGLGAELCCMLFLAQLSDTITTIIRFIALGSIAKVDDFYAGAIPSDYILKQKNAPLPTSICRGDVESRNRPCCMRILRFFHKLLRILYASFFYYFLPYFAILVVYRDNPIIGQFSCPGQEST